MRATLIHNPTAGDGQPTAEDLEKILSAAGFQVRYQSTKKNWKKALERSADLVVAAGGDGTVAKVLKELAGTDRIAAVLPIGTANNIARTLGVHGDAQEIVAAWVNETPEAFDIGRIWSDGQESRFVEGCGGGLFAQAIIQGQEQVENPGSLVGGEVDRALVMLRRLVMAGQPTPWQLEVDGADLSGEYLAVEVMNIRHAGPNVAIAPRADPGDGLLDVVTIGEADCAGLIDYLDQRLAQHDVRVPRLRTIRGRRVLMQADGAPRHVDDDVAESNVGPWTATVLPAAVRVLRGVTT